MTMGMTLCSMNSITRSNVAVLSVAVGVEAIDRAPGGRRRDDIAGEGEDGGGDRRCGGSSSRELWYLELADDVATDDLERGLCVMKVVVGRFP